MQVMISYGRQHEDFAVSLTQKLESEGVEVWIDKKYLLPGKSWRRGIYNAVISSDVIIVCLSKGYTESSICRMETFLAQSYNKLIIPLIVDESWALVQQTPDISLLADLYVLSYGGSTSFGAELSEDVKFEKIMHVINHGIPQPEPHDVYLTFSKHDADFAVKLKNDLDALGISAWCGAISYYPGQRVNDLAWQMLRSAKILVPVLSINLSGSDFIRKEVLVAQTRDLSILPIVHSEIAANDEKIHNLTQHLDEEYETRILNEIFWIFESSGYDAMIQELVGAIRKIIG